MIANCKQCGRIFQKVIGDRCPDCVKLDEELFENVRSYLKEHKHATMVDVIEGNDVTTEQLIEWIEEGRLILRDHPNFSIECERCHMPTQTGRYCDKCTKEMFTVFADATEKVRTLKQQLPSKSAGYFTR